MTKLDDLAKEVAEDQAAIDGKQEDTRSRVIRMGKTLAKMQAEQKKEQQAAKEAGETPVPWRDWVEEKKSLDDFFPGFTACNKYALIAKYPKSYRKDMSIDQAYREAGRWKKNGGSPPEKEKKTVTDALMLIQKSAGQAERRIEDICNRIAESDAATVAQESKWDDDLIAGTREACDDCRKACLMMIRQLDGIYEQT